MTCYGQDYTECLACNDTYYLSESTCTQVCPTDNYKNATDRACYKCPVSCKECSPVPVCTVCADGYFNNNTNVNPLDCVRCRTFCASCASYEICDTCQAEFSWNVSAGECVCANNLFLQNSTTCVQKCDNGYYGASDGVCTTCSKPCKTCLDATRCETCIGGFKIQGEDCICISGFRKTGSLICLSNCPVNYYSNQTDAKCYACDGKCYQCFGPTDNDCSACKPSYYLQGTQCAGACLVPGFYEDSLLNECVKCQFPCETCQTSATECSACAEGSYQDPSSSAPPLLCVACPENCKQCNQNGECTSCYTEYGWELNAQNLCECDAAKKYNNSGVCVSQCPISTYTDEANQQCVKCPINCLACEVTTSQQLACTSCVANQTVVNGQCLCQSGYLQRDDVRLCTDSCPLG